MIMYGLVLEGGGGRGAYQIGACKAISEMGLEISMVAGTSVGALNGAMVVQGDIEKAYDIWYDLEPGHVLKMTEDYMECCCENGSAFDAKLFIRRMKKVIADGGLDVEPLERLVKSVLDEDRIRRSPTGFGVVTVDLTRRRAVEIYKEDMPMGQLVDYVIASASFPVFKRTMIDGRAFIDGALYNNLPINLVSSRGFKDIIVLRTYGMGIKRRVDTSGLNIISILPSDSLGSTMDFRNKTARKNLKLGYEDACRVLEKHLRQPVCDA
jgi:NTE family protein